MLVPATNTSQSSYQPPFWTTERVDLLKKYASEGMSFSQIGSALGVNRNKIAGKMHREGFKTLRKRAPNLTPEERQRRRLQSARNYRVTHMGVSRKRPAPPRPEVPPIADMEIPLTQRRDILTVSAHECRWPVGDPSKLDFFLCGGKVEDNNRSYCAGHYELGTERRR